MEENDDDGWPPRGRQLAAITAILAGLVPVITALTGLVNAWHGAGGS